MSYPAPQPSGLAFENFTYQQIQRKLNNGDELLFIFHRPSARMVEINEEVLGQLRNYAESQCAYSTGDVRFHVGFKQKVPEPVEVTVASTQIREGDIIDGLTVTGVYHRMHNNGATCMVKEIYVTYKVQPGRRENQTFPLKTEGIWSRTFMLKVMRVPRGW